MVLLAKQEKNFDYQGKYRLSETTFINNIIFVYL